MAKWKYQGKGGQNERKCLRAVDLHETKNIQNVPPNLVLFLPAGIYRAATYLVPQLTAPELSMPQLAPAAIYLVPQLAVPQLAACRNLPPAAIFRAATCHCRNFPVTDSDILSITIGRHFYGLMQLAMVNLRLPVIKRLSVLAVWSVILN